MPLPRKGAPAPTDADDRFDDPRHPPRDARLNGSRSSGARVSSERHRRRVGRSLLAQPISAPDGANSLPEAGGAYARGPRPQSVTAVPPLANLGARDRSRLRPALLASRYFRYSTEADTRVAGCVSIAPQPGAVMKRASERFHGSVGRGSDQQGPLHEKQPRCVERVSVTRRAPGAEPSTLSCRGRRRSR